jgi:hypothetical protein
MHSEEYRERPLGDWTPSWPTLSGDVSYVKSFSLESIPAGPTRVNLGTVRYAAHVHLNGKDLGTRCWEPFAVDATGALKSGKNMLEVIVTNTLASQSLRPEIIEMDARNKWLNAYRKRTIEFERSSLPSGLFGPVRLERAP